MDEVRCSTIGGSTRCGALPLLSHKRPRIMKLYPTMAIPLGRLAVTLPFLTLPAATWADTIFSENFNSNSGYTAPGTFGNGSGTSTAAFSRVNSSGQTLDGGSVAISLDGTQSSFGGFSGNFFFTDNIDAGGNSSDTRTITFPSQNTAGFTSMMFSMKVAAGDSGSTSDNNPPSDIDHFLAVIYSTDGGTNWIPGLIFNVVGPTSDATNKNLAKVSTITPTGGATLTSLGNSIQSSENIANGGSSGATALVPYSEFNNAGGAVLNANAQSFSFSIPDASTVQIKLVMRADDTHVEFAFDDILLQGDPVAANPAPTRVNTTAADVGEPDIGATSYSFTVQYADDSAVVASTIGPADVTVTGPGGPLTVTGGSTSDPSGTPVTATYTVTPPGGSWDAADNGTYNIAVAANQVGDDGTPQLFVAAGAAGSFNVNATNTTPVADGVFAADVPFDGFGATSYSFTISYSDVGGIDASSIGPADVTVTGPGGPLTVTGGSTSDPNGPSVTATYTVTPPGGAWDSADDGTYTIGIVGSQVFDVASAAVAANASAATFSVSSAQVSCETFETDGAGTRYTITGGTAFHTGANTYFTRINDTNGNTAGGETPAIDLDGDTDDEYDDFAGQWYFAAEDVDAGGGGGAFRVIDLNTINTASHDTLVFSGLFGAGDTDSIPSYDSDHFLAVLYSTDGGTNYTPGLVFRANVTSSDATNAAFAKVNTIAASGANGVNTLQDLGARLSAGTIVSGTSAGAVYSYMLADSGINAAAGTALTHALMPFNFTIPGTPAAVDIRIVLRSDGTNMEMAFDQLKLSGNFLGVNAAPSVLSTTATNVGEPDIGASSYSFTVQYADDSAVVASTIGTADVTVTGPGGPLTVTGGSTSDPNGSPVTATYTVTPPGGSWDAADNGTYNIAVVGNQVGDDGTVQLFVPAGAAGSFSVNATNNSPVVSGSSAPDVIFTDFGATSYSFTVTYTDGGAVDASTIGASDVTVTGPGGPLTVTGGSTSDSDGSPVTATYTVTPPGGSWDGADSGTYTIGLVGSQVSDTLGASAAANASLASFQVLAGKLLNEGFETDGEGTRYTTNGGTANHFFNPGSSTDYFTRVVDTGSGPSPAILLDADPAGTNYSSFAGTGYFAAENVDFGSRPAFRVVDFTPIDTSSFTGLGFMGLFGAGDTDSNPAYDSDHFLAVLYSTDGGTTYLPGLVFRANVTSSDATNGAFAEVNTVTPSGSNGINTLADLGAQLSAGSIVLSTGNSDVFSYIAADSGSNAAIGTALGPALQSFTFSIPDASEVRLRLVLQADDTNVEMAFDNLMLTGTSTDSTGPTAALADPANGGNPTAAALNGNGYIDVTFADSGSGLNPATVGGDEFSLSGAGAAGVTLGGTATLQSGTTYRFPFTGSFVPGPVSVSFTASTFGDLAGNLNAAAGQGFTVANSPPNATADSVDRFPTQSVKIPVADLLSDDTDPEGDTPLSITGVTYTGGNGASVTLSGDTVFYNPNGHTGADTFTYTVQDSLGNSTSGVLVSVNIITDNSASANITDISFPGNGTAVVSAVGIPGRSYRVQTSPTLTPGSWTDAATVVADATGAITYTDPGPLPPTRFYRTVHP